MNEQYTIGRLAQAAGVPSSTVRYYERRGLLAPQARSEGNYRLYGPQSLERLRFVRSAQSAGFTLSDIAVLLRYRDGEVAPCPEVQALITTRLESVAKQISHLRQVERMLRKWLSVCRQSGRSGTCGVLAGLAESDGACCQKDGKSS